MILDEIIIRPANEQDAKEWAVFSAQRFSDTFGLNYHAEDLKEHLAEFYNVSEHLKFICDKEKFHRLALHNNIIVGFVTGGPNKLPLENAAPQAFEMYKLYVAENMKGTGLAQALFDEIMHHYKMIKAPEFLLGVFSQNKRALGFYEKQGFTIVGKYLYRVGRTLDDERIMRFQGPKNI